MSREDAKVWFEETLPKLGEILLKFPSLLESHYDKSNETFGGDGKGLRILREQHPGIVLLSQVSIIFFILYILLYINLFF